MIVSPCSLYLILSHWFAFDVLAFVPQTPSSYKRYMRGFFFCWFFLFFFITPCLPSVSFSHIQFAYFVLPMYFRPFSHGDYIHAPIILNSFKAICHLNDSQDIYKTNYSSFWRVTFWYILLAEMNVKVPPRASVFYGSSWYLVAINRIYSTDKIVIILLILPV